MARDREVQPIADDIRSMAIDLVSEVTKLDPDVALALLGAWRLMLERNTKRRLPK